MHEPEEPRAFDLVSMPAEIAAFPIFGVLLLTFAGAGAALLAIVGNALGLRFFRSDLGPIMLFFGLLAWLAMFLPRYSPVSQHILRYRLELWPRGVAHGWGKNLRFVPYARMRKVDQDASEVRLTLTDGNTLTFQPIGASRRAPEDQTDAVEYRIRTCRALATLLEEAIVREKNAASARVRTRPSDFESTVALLARRGRPVAEWHAELAGLAAGTTRYRVAPLRDDTLVRIATDADVEEDTRAAAQRVLAARRS